MDAFMDLPTETEASAPVVEKENEEPTESAIIKDKVIASEITPRPPIVNEEVVDTVEINIENVDSSDVSVAVENEKNEKLKLKYKYKEDQWSPINHEGKKQYDRDFLLQLQNAPESMLKPLDLPDIPDIIIEKAPTRSANRDFAEGSSFVDFIRRYVWSGGPNRGRASGQRGRGGPGGSATQAKHINLSIQKDIELHHAKEAWKPGHRVEKMDGEVDLKSEATTNYNQRMTSPAFQNSMPTTQQGLFQLPQENTGIFTPHAHTHAYNNPPAVFYNTAQLQNRPPSASGMSGPGQQPAKKRERKGLPIIDPNSGKDITLEVQQARGTPPSSATLGPHSTVSGQESTETEASAPVVEKENEEPMESAIIKDKVIASEITPPPPIVNEEVVDTVKINIENVDSSDVSVAVENEKNEKLKLKYKYKEDQWSPINHEGKKQYDRDFLLQLQNAPESTLKPLDLPDIPDIIIEKAPTQSANRDFAEGSSFVDLTPRYVWSGGQNLSGGVPRRASGQRGRGGPGGSATQAKHINLSIQKDTEQNHAKEAWKPGHRVEKMDGEVDLKSEELFKKVRAILNKLTPQKFQTLVAKMQALEIDTEARLKSVIDLVFEKAISEPGFSVAYANMCRCLSMFKVPAESKKGDVNFRALLLTRCQREFEKANSSEKEFDSMRKKIEKATSEEQKQQMKEELEAEQMKAKRRSLGNIRFIGELFKLKMLTPNIMHDCVFKLLRTKDEDNLECLCRLLKTILKELETDKAKPRMDQYFAQMQKIVNEKKLSSRVCLMLQDVIELRQTTTSYPQRMSSPAFQNSMPTAQQGLFQLPQENTGIFTPHAHTHIYNNPPAVFYNTAQQQNKLSSASGISGPGQQPAKKLERILLPMIDPNSGKDILSGPGQPLHPCSSG